MPQSYTQILVHMVFSTKGWQPFVDNELKPELFPYMGGIIREIGGTPYIINGTTDHVHALAAVPPTKAISDFLCILKTNSSRWVHERWPHRSDFGWQNGYGAFSVSASNQEAVSRYITNQEKHHKKTTFKEEFLELLKKHGVKYDERYIWL